MAFPSGPGLLFVRSQFKPNAPLSASAYNKWYNEVHLPDVLRITGGSVSKAFRFKCVDDEYAVPYLAIYKLPDMSAVDFAKMRTVPMTSDLLPDPDRPVQDWVEFDSRFYAFVDDYQTAEYEEDYAPILMTAAMTPSDGGDADLTAWYKDEHFEQMGKEPGWVRTTRFKLVFQAKDDDGRAFMNDDVAPTWLALHEFKAENKLGKKVQALDPITDWTRKVMSASKKIDAAIYEKIAQVP